MTPALEPYLGVWVLDPARCDYGAVPAPRSGVCTLLADGEKVQFHVRWVDADGVPHEVAFDGVPDGVPRPSGARGEVVTRLEDGRLVTELRDAGRVVHRAERTLDPERTAMGVVQVLAGDPEPVVTRATYVRSDVKQVLVYRSDLGMRKGKIAAQCAHASLAVFLRRATRSATALTVPLDGPMAWWTTHRFTKVVLSVESEAELERIHVEATRRGIPAALITDAGRTEFGGVPTRTVVAVGPAAVPEIDAITGPGGLVATKLA